MEKYDRGGQATDDIIRRVLFARWITKVTYTHSEYVILIVCPRQRWLRECPSVLRYTDIGCLVLLTNSAGILCCHVNKIYKCCPVLRSLSCILALHFKLSSKLNFEPCRSINSDTGVEPG